MAHCHQEFIAFLRRVDRETPPGLDLHLVLDNCGTRKHAKTRAWQAKLPWFHLHCTPTSASWLSQAERCWFAVISRRAIRRGSFDGVRHLHWTIESFIADFNETASPLVWVATADSTLGRLERSSTRICGTEH